MAISHYDSPPMDEVLQAYNLPGVHPAANLFPLIEGQDFDVLCDSIGKDGLEQDIVLTHDGMLLDGRNRLRACYVTGQLERFRRLGEMYANGYVGYVVRLNIHRRHLSASEKAAIAAEALDMYEAEAKARQRDSKIGNKNAAKTTDQRIDQLISEPCPSIVCESCGNDKTEQGLDGFVCANCGALVEAFPEDEQELEAASSSSPRAPQAVTLAAADFGTNRQYVSDAKKIKQEAPEVFEKVKAGTVSIPQAKREIKTAMAKPRAYITLSQWQNEKMTAVPEPTGNALTYNKQDDTAEDSMGNIEWADWSWNPVTGCKHDCSYCYARDIAKRYYPQGFEPCIHPDRLAIPYTQKVPKDADIHPAKRNVFANSMSDLYGRWVPKEWIDAVFKAMADNPQWNFLTLTKFPKRAAELVYPPNVWIGTSVDLQVRVAAAEDAFSRIQCGVKWLSLEPMIEPLTFSRPELFDWVVIGGASASSKTPAWTPPFAWIVRTAAQFLEANPNVKIYLKTNGRPREFPGIITQDNAHESFRYLGK
jgi:protein gp37